MLVCVYNYYYCECHCKALSALLMSWCTIVDTIVGFDTSFIFRTRRFACVFVQYHQSNEHLDDGYRHPRQLMLSLISLIVDALCMKAGCDL